MTFMANVGKWRFTVTTKDFIYVMDFIKCMYGTDNKMLVEKSATFDFGGLHLVIFIS